MKRNITLFYFYRIVSRLYFYLPVLFVFFYLKDIHLVLIEILLAMYGVMIMLTSQINARMLKYMKHKTVIAIGESIKALGFITIILGQNFWQLLLAQVLSGIGYSITAGTDTGLLRSIFDNYPQELYRRVESRSNSYMFISFLFAGIFGSFLFNINQKLVFYVSIIAPLLSALVILLIKEDRVSATNSDNKQELNQISLTPDQLFWKYYYGISRAFALASFVGLLPYLFFVKIHISMKFFGLVLSLFTLSGFLSSRYILRLGNVIGFKRLALYTMVVGAVSLALFSLFNYHVTCLIAIILLGATSGGIRPLATTNINIKDFSAQQRVYILSSMEKVYGLWNPLIMIFGGIMLELIGIQWLFMILSAFYILPLFVLYKKFIGQFTELH